MLASLIGLLGVSFLTVDYCFAAVDCRAAVNQDLPQITELSKQVDSVWLLNAPTFDQDRQYREKVARGERPLNPMIGGVRGLGTSEEAVSFAYDNMASFLTSILENQKESFTPDELTLLTKIAGLTTHPAELRFVSERTHPGFFDVQNGTNIEKSRIAKTDSSPASPIYINADQVQAFVTLSGSSMTGKFTLLSRFAKIEYVAQMFGLLVHELGHHLGVKDTEDRPLDVLAAKVSNIFQQSSGFHSLSDHGLDYLAVLNTNLGRPGKDTQTGRIVFYLPEHIFDFTESTRQQFEKSFGQKVTGIWVQSFRWQPLGQWDMARQAQPFSAESDVVFRTADGKLFIAPVRWLLMVSHQGKLDVAYALRTNWKDSLGFIPASQFERELGLKILKDRVRLFTEKDLSISSQVTGLRAADSVMPGEGWNGEIQISSTAKISHAEIIMSSDEFSHDSLFENYEMSLQNVFVDNTLPNNPVIRFFNQFAASSSKRTLYIKKIILHHDDGVSEDVFPIEKQKVQINGPTSKAEFVGFGMHPSSLNLSGVRVDVVPCPKKSKLCR